MYCLEVLKQFQIRFSFLEFHFVVKSFLTIIDIFTLTFLLLIARHQSLSLERTAILFYLNPVSFLLTGYHGQIENLALFPVVVGVCLYLILDPQTRAAKFALWALTTLGLITKHIVCYLLVVSLDTGYKSNVIKVSLFALSSALFALSFIGFWKHGNHEIINYVIRYSSYPRPYGIILLSSWPGLKYVFLLGLFLFPLCLRGVDLINKCLLTTLFFLVFATGMSIQTFVLPIAFAALSPSRGFALYSVAATAYILCSQENLHVFPPYEMPWNIVWLGAVFWFVDDLRKALPIFSKERGA
jgi:hypothetical protein